MNKALLSSENMNWCTPQDFFNALDAEFHFVLDAAATEKSKKCARCYTPETDGLSQSWDVGGAVFCNPPYGRQIGEWVKKAYTEATRGGTPLFCLSRRAQILHTSTITFTRKPKSALFAGGCTSQTKTATQNRPRRSRQCL